jgi:predicted Fe-S protein YdhL (DUF1289 family)
VCRGCRRLSQEVVRWNGFSTDEKLVIIDRLGALIELVMAEKIERLEVDLLTSALRQFSIRYYPQHPPITWAYALIRNRADKRGERQGLEEYGVWLKPEYRSASLTSLLSEIEEALYEQSQTLNS